MTFLWNELVYCYIQNTDVGLKKSWNVLSIARLPCKTICQMRILQEIIMFCALPIPWVIYWSWNCRNRFENKPKVKEEITLMCYNIVWNCHYWISFDDPLMPIFFGYWWISVYNDCGLLFMFQDNYYPLFLFILIA